MKTPFYYYKIAVLATVLLILSVFLTITIVDYVNTENYLVIPRIFAARTITLFLLLLIVNALMVGCWDVWQQYIFQPLPIALGVFIPFFNIEPAYALLAFLAVFVILVIDIAYATRLKNLFIKFDPLLIMKFSAKGLVLAFSLTALLIAILKPTEKISTSLTRSLSNMVSTVVSSQVEKVQEKQLESMGLSSGSLKAFGVNTLIDTEAGIKKTVESELDSLVKKYKNLVNPIVGLLVFGVVQFLGIITFIFYSILIKPIFWLALKLGLFVLEKKQVEQEVLRF